MKVMSSATELKYREIQGDLIELAKKGEFDVIAHGCNCMCNMGAGIAIPMKLHFQVDRFKLERVEYETEYGDKYPSNNKGDINKLGQIDYAVKKLNPRQSPNKESLYVVNAYTQYNYGRNHTDGDSKPLDYSALRLCMKKINHIFKGKKIGLPRIGAGLAGGDWGTIQAIIQEELKDCDVTIVRLPNT